MRKPTLHDVARAAGVSYATADRVLNSRGGVAEKSAARVRDAITQLGYMRDVHAANLSRRRIYRFLFVLPTGEHSFFRALRASLAAERSRRAIDRIEFAVLDVPAFAPEALAEALDRIEPETCDCVAIVASRSRRVDAAVERLRENGVRVVALVSDAASEHRDAYVGIDNTAAGRTAARLMLLGHFGRGGRLLPIIGSFGATDHADRLSGFTEVAAEAGDIHVLPALEGGDDPTRIESLVGMALASSEPPTGIYSIGAGNRGLVAALQGAGPKRPLVILHELVPASREALVAGRIDAVIDQKPAEEIAAALDAMRALAEGREPAHGHGAIVPAIYLKDNVPAAFAESAHRGTSIQ